MLKGNALSYDDKIATANSTAKVKFVKMRGEQQYTWKPAFSNTRGKIIYSLKVDYVQWPHDTPPPKI